MLISEPPSYNHPGGTRLKRGKKILEELQQKACELSTILGSEVTTKTSSNPLNQAGSSEVLALPAAPTCQAFKGNLPLLNPTQGKGPFMTDVILLTGPDINSIPRQGKRAWLAEFCLLKKHMQTFVSNAKNASSTEICLSTLLGNSAYTKHMPAIVQIAEVALSMPLSNAWPGGVQVL